MPTQEVIPMAMLCKECGASVPGGQSVCPQCRSIDLQPVAGPGPAGAGGSVESYHTYQRRRRLAAVATAATTLCLMAIGIAVAIGAKEMAPAGDSPGGADGGFSLVAVWRVVLFLFVINPMVLAAVCLILGLFSYRLWHRALTGERAETGLSVLAMLGGRPSRQQ